LSKYSVDDWLRLVIEEIDKIFYCCELKELKIW